MVIYLVYEDGELDLEDVCQTDIPVFVTGDTHQVDLATRCMYHAHIWIERVICAQAKSSNNLVLCMALLLWHTPACDKQFSGDVKYLTCPK